MYDKLKEPDIDLGGFEGGFKDGVNFYFSQGMYDKLKEPDIDLGGFEGGFKDGVNFYFSQAGG
ncbi:hypothetical protein [uncultured Desulfosarcina sp.]|uniref:hypothetical protein n=1 Tax=uncultured Desulfosarcina sp. TaxID=218289 RepID=UPI0029C83FFA|nr:hypothetical protein [uncultured Desulfosarcina sp.]